MDWIVMVLILTAISYDDCNTTKLKNEEWVCSKVQSSEKIGKSAECIEWKKK